MKENINKANVMKFAGAQVACTTGAGFASGQEVIQFFSAHGIMSIVGTGISMFLTCWCWSVLLKHGKELNLKVPSNIIRYYFGNKIGFVFEVLFQIFLYMIFVIMISGSGATLAEHFGMNPVVGRIGMSVLSFLTVILGLNGLSSIMSKVGIGMVVFAIIVGFISFVRNIDELALAKDLIPTLEMQKYQGGWLFSSIVYAGCISVPISIMSADVGTTANSGKEALYGGIIGGILYGLSLLCMNLGLMANIAALYDKEVPTLMLASNISPFVGTLLSIAIVCGIYGTSTSMLWGVTRKFAKEKTKRFYIVALIATILGFGLGLTDFKVLVGMVYPLSGYMGILLFLSVFYHQFFEKGDRGKIGMRLNGEIQ